MMNIVQYELLHKRGLEAAWFQTREDVAAGRYRQESAEAHLRRVRAELFSINLQYRVTLELEVREREIILVNVGGRGEVY